MITLIFGDNLLIKQTSDILTTPWGYRIVDVETDTIVTQDSGLTSTHEIIELTEDGDFADYLGQMLLLELLDGSNNVIEDDTILLSGIYIQTVKLQKIVGLFGENVKYSAPSANDFQEGHEKHRTVTLYTEPALTNTLASYDWQQDYVTDFTPDARFQVQKVVQKEN